MDLTVNNWFSLFSVISYMINSLFRISFTVQSIFETLGEVLGFDGEACLFHLGVVVVVVLVRLKWTDKY